MPRHYRSQTAIEVQLLPFLSVLACTIGTLILLILVLTSQLYSQQQTVKIIAKTESGKNFSKKPRYIECNKDGIIIYPSQEFIAEAQLSNVDSPLRELLEEINNNREEEYLIVAVRPDGIEVFREVRELIEAKNIDIGYEPIDQEWQLKIEE